MSRHSAARLLSAVALFCFLASPADSQTLGTILGTVTDDSGAVIPGVTVEITNFVTSELSAKRPRAS